MNGRLARAKAADMNCVSRRLRRAPRACLEIQVYYLHTTAMTIQSPVPDFAAAREAMVENQL